MAAGCWHGSCPLCTHDRERKNARQESEVIKVKRAKQFMRTFIMTGVVTFVLNGFVSPEVAAFAAEEGEMYVEITGSAEVEFAVEEAQYVEITGSAEVEFVVEEVQYVEITGIAEVKFVAEEEEAEYVEITGSAEVNFVAGEEMTDDCGVDGVKLVDITHVGDDEVWYGERISLDRYSLEGAYLVVRGEVSPASGCEIGKVRVSTDDGISWEDADVAGDGRWEYRFVPAEDATYNIIARAAARRASR